MTKSLDVIRGVLGSAVATGGTFTVNYPTGRSRGNYLKGKNHLLIANQTQFVCPTSFTLTFNASNITVTYNGSTTLAANSPFSLQLDIGGDDEVYPFDSLTNGIVAPVQVVYVDLGSPITADATALISAATGSELPNNATKTYTTANIGTSPADGASTTWILDIPRNVSATVTHATSIVATTITVTGKDIYNKTVVETLSITATGTSKTAAGKKAFKSVSRVDIVSASDSTANTVNLGFADVLGLPVYLPATALGAVLKELENNATATAGTLVGGLATTTKSTATTADVRGTYAPNSASDGSKGFSLIVALEDPTFKGNPQYAG